MKNKIAETKYYVHPELAEIFGVWYDFINDKRMQPQHLGSFELKLVQQEKRFFFYENFEWLNCSLDVRVKIVDNLPVDARSKAWAYLAQCVKRLLDQQDQANFYRHFLQTLKYEDHSEVFAAFQMNKKSLPQYVSFLERRYLNFRLKLETLDD